MRVLALRALGLGDLLTAVPALRALQAWAARTAKGSDPFSVMVDAATTSALAPLVELAGCRHVPAEPLGPLPPRRPGPTSS